MNLIQAVETIDKHQENVNDKVLLGEEPYPPDEYFLAVSTVLPILKCLSCIVKWASLGGGTQYVPRCDSDGICTHHNGCPCMDTPQYSADALPFG